MDESGETFNDMLVSNNGDSYKVLATVAATVVEFTENHPKAAVLASGSTKSRTRLYRMALNRYLCDIQQQFVIFGYCRNNYWETFIRDQEYEAFLLTRSENQQQLWLELQIVNQMIKTGE
nr:hypothetical protein [Dyadobacter sp. 50-39]